MKFVTAAVFVFLGAIAHASPCIPGTLQDYVSLDPAVGCNIGSVLFQNFELA